MVNTRSGQTSQPTTTTVTNPTTTTEVSNAPPPPISETTTQTITEPLSSTAPGTHPLGTNPQHTINPSLQMVNSPLGGTQPLGAHISSTMIPASTNPLYGLPNYPVHSEIVGGSGHAYTVHEPYDPPYITGLGPHEERRYRDYSSAYTDDSSDDEGRREEAPRRRRASKQPEWQSRRLDDGPPLTAAERIKAHEAEIRRLKHDLEREQQRRNQPPSKTVPIIDLTSKKKHRRAEDPHANAENPRGDPHIQILPGDPNDPRPPFTEEVMNAHISRKFKMPTIKTYDGTGDPENHVRTFSNALLLQPASDALKCRAFPQTLAGMAQRWYSRLPPNSVGSFRELSTAFISQFISGRVHEKSSASLMNVTQGKNENLRDYLKRFTKETLNIPDLENKVAMIAMQHGTTDVYFKMSLAKHPPENMTELQQRASKYIKAEESMKKTEITNVNDGSGKRKTEHEYDVKDKYPRTDKDSSSRKVQGPRFTEYARLNAPRSQILLDIEKDEEFRWPKPLRGDPAKRDKNQYCRYHRDVGHNTDDCNQLKDEIEFLIRRGKLSKFTKGEERNYPRKDYDRRDDDRDRNPQPRGPVINMISGGPTLAGTSRNSRKAYAREVMNVVGEAPKCAKIEVTITFDDSEGVKFPHDDPLVITSMIGNSPVKRVLIDNGASVDILFYDAFLKMGYNDSQLTPTNMPIYGFNGVESKVEGTIRLPMTLGEAPREATQMINFLIIKAASTYNAILGRTGLHIFKAVASTYHLKIKFPTKNGVGEHRGDQKMARSCYMASLRPEGVGGQALPIEDIDFHEDEEHQAKQAEELILEPLKNTGTTHPRLTMAFGLKNAGATNLAIGSEDFNIQNKPQTAIKAPALPNFVAKGTLDNHELGGQQVIPQEGNKSNDVKEGMLYFNGVSKTKLDDAYPVLQSPEGPYLVKKTLGQGSYKLETVDGNKVPRT